MNPLELTLDAQGIATLAIARLPTLFPNGEPGWAELLRAAVDDLIGQKDRVRGVLIEFRPEPVTPDPEPAEALPEEGARIYRTAEAVKGELRRLETLGKPIVACLTHDLVDGDWEVALAAHYRIALNRAQLRFGLTHVNFGVMPGAGGTIRSVRLLGMVNAAPLLLEGRTLDLASAREAGLIDACADDPEALADAAREWIESHPESQQPWDRKGYRIPGGGVATPAVAQAVLLAPALLRQKTRGLYPAPEAILATMVDSLAVDFGTALRIESRYYAKLCAEPVTRNLVTLAGQRRALESGRLRPPGASSARVTRVAIVGAGMMGSGIAYANALRGITALVSDVSRERAQGTLDHARRVSDTRRDKGQMDERQQTALLARLELADATDPLPGTDVVIEAVFEDAALKKQVLRRLEEGAPATALLASNTSTLPISELAGALEQPGRALGLHFFSPVERMPLVEIVRGQHTSDESLARAYDYVTQLGKVPIVVNDSRGFFTSRTFGSFVLEGAAMLTEGVPAALIENGAHAAGLPTGPLALLDETSLRLSMHVAREAAKAFAAAGRQMAVHPGERVVARMVEEFNRAGRAAGGGFYEYPDGARKFLWPGLAAAFPRAAASPSIDEIRDRLLYRQAIEAARCLDEGVLRSTAEGNIGSILGIGFPAWTGGVLQFIHHVGAVRFAACARRFEEQHGARYALAPGLLERTLAARALG